MNSQKSSNAIVVWRAPCWSTVLPLLWNTCFIQKHAVEQFSCPSSARWSSSVASAGSLMTGADRLKTLPPRSRTKWLWVATKANAIESGVADAAWRYCRYSYHG